MTELGDFVGREREEMGVGCGRLYISIIGMSAGIGIKNGLQQIKGSRNATMQREALTEAIAAINEQAYKLSLKEPASAVLRLKAAEQMLEYAAESCQNIRRELIILVLHNIVSLSQVQWDLTTASNYLEGLIYNLEITNSSKNNSRITVENTPASQSLLNEEDVLGKTELAEYYLQYCAINSQLRKHKNAQTSAKKAVRILAQLLKQECIKKAMISDIAQGEVKRNILKIFLQKWVSGIHDKQHASNFISICQHLWKKETNTNKKNALQAELKVFSIGNVMTLEYKHIDADKKGELTKNVCYHFILISMALFSLGTQARFEEKLAEAKHYHALAILFYFTFVPYQSPYLHHIKDNYVRNYGEFPLHDVSPSKDLTFKQFWVNLKKDSLLQSSFNLQQESINTVQQQKRKNERLKHQNLKLKHICLAQNKPKHHNKSEEKAKSLTISHSNQKKVSIDMKKHTDRKYNGNKTNPHHQQTDKAKQTKKRDKPKETTNNNNNNTKDEMAERYFQMAFKKQKMKSPAPQRKNSIRSTSSTTKDRSGNEHKHIVHKSKEKRSKLKSKKCLKY